MGSSLWECNTFDERNFLKIRLVYIQIFYTQRRFDRSVTINHSIARKGQPSCETFVHKNGDNFKVKHSEIILVSFPGMSPIPTIVLNRGK